MRRVSLRKTLFILPNMLTMGSILCGFYALVICSGTPTDDDFYTACLLVILAAFLDSIDGRVARLTKTQSAIGVQLDSLADVMSFGMVPAVIAYSWSLHELGTNGVFIAFTYLAAGTFRLARFNVMAMTDDGKPKPPGKYMMGLPIPAAAAILISIVVAHTLTGRVSQAPVFVGGVVLALAFFMVSKVPFRSFKDLKLNARTAVFVMIALGTTGYVALRYHPSMALVWMLGCYVTIGLAETVIHLARRLAGGPKPKEGET